MTLNGFFALAWQSVTAPREVARLLLSLRLNTEALILSFSLVVVLQTVLVTMSAQIRPPDPALAPLLGQPLVFLVGLATVLIVLVLALTWAGRGLGGAGRVQDVALLVAWLQGLDVLVQLVLLLMLPVAPVLAGLVSLLATGAGLWILLNFLAEAQGFEGVGKSALALLLAVTGLALGLALFVTLSGATVEAVPHV
ncbi:YIP1 family protein [Roseivivax sediminis]|uniref:Yip1 domain-containing protein n=1 Tax=Roseivivax sediminis TaxID=936889 RepID=A0A1I1XZZ5_9RHOB|nr:YIP1 family protein [Roseivivax sediminis]SFE12712.1 Yip1 domain-containing protein [Roseivivax sediminis]